MEEAADSSSMVPAAVAAGSSTMAVPHTRRVEAEELFAARSAASPALKAGSTRGPTFYLSAIHNPWLPFTTRISRGKARDKGMASTRGRACTSSTPTGTTWAQEAMESPSTAATTL